MWAHLCIFAQVGPTFDPYGLTTPIKDPYRKYQPICASLPGEYHVGPICSCLTGSGAAYEPDLIQTVDTQPFREDLLEDARRMTHVHPVC